MNDELPSAAVEITDGLVNTPDLDLQQVISEQPTDALARRVAALASDGGNPRASLIAVEGVGAVPGQYQAQQESQTTDKLLAVYQQACALLHPANCSVATG